MNHQNLLEELSDLLDMMSTPYGAMISAMYDCALQQADPGDPAGVDGTAAFALAVIAPATQRLGTYVACPKLNFVDIDSATPNNPAILRAFDIIHDLMDSGVVEWETPINLPNDRRLFVGSGHANCLAQQHGGFTGLCWLEP